MAALLDTLLAGRDDSAAQAIRQAGLPGPRSEVWKYTSLRALERRGFAPATAPRVDPAQVAGIPAPRLVFANGHFDAALSDLSGLPGGVTIEHGARTDAGIAIEAHETPWQPAGDAVFANLNAMLARQGVHVRADAGTDATVHLVTLNIADGEDRAIHLRHSVQLAESASLRLVEHHLGDDDHANLDNSRIDVTLAANARLAHLRVQDDSPRATRFLHSHVRLAADAEYRRLDLELGAALSRHELDVRLEGESARASAGGVLLAGGRRHLDTRLGIHHLARDTTSDLPWRGLAEGRARVAFHGGIRIEAGADGSEADLQNRNLLLSEEAEIDTQPVLVIHADEVKAAHGATVGQLDANALFYLRSRGLPEPDARRILTAAFCRSVLSRVEDAGLASLLERRLDDALARMQAA